MLKCYIFLLVIQSYVYLGLEFVLLKGCIIDVGIILDFVGVINKNIFGNIFDFNKFVLYFYDILYIYVIVYFLLYYNL